MRTLSIVLNKEPDRDARGNQVYEIGPEGKRIPAYLCGFCIGGGVDQDMSKCPFGYKDNGVYVTHVYPRSPADVAGLQIHDKILEVNSIDFTNLTHHQAVESIKEKSVINMVLRRPST